MKRRSAVRYGIVAALSMAWSVPASADETPAPAAVSHGEKRDIEDVELDRLLDVKLDEKLGTTAAVSRRTESVLRAPATITTLDADRIRLSGATTVPELLRWVPGVQVVRNAPGNDVVSLRGTGGLAGNDLVVLVDGMMMNSPLDGSVQWDLFPVSVADIERIEVVRGPVSPIYGPNAYTGVINIVTRESAYSPSAVAVRALTGVDDQARGMGAASGRIAHSGERLRGAGYWNFRYDATNGGGGSAAGLPHWGAMGTAGRLAYRVGKNSDVSLELALSRSRRAELDHLAPHTSALGRSQMLAIAKYQLSGLLDGRLGFDAWARTNVQRHDAAPPARRFSYGNTDAMRGEAGSDLTLKLDWLSATTGASVSGEHVDAPYIHPADNAKLRSGYGFFGSATATPWRMLDLSLAARGDAPPTMGRLAGSYRASAVLHGETTALRLSAGSSYRAPSWVEGAGRFVDPANGLILLEGTPRIAPPRNDAVELGLVWGPTPNLQLKPTVYASRLTDVVVQDFGSLVRKTFKNDTSERVVLGGELEASWRIRENLLVQGWGSLLSFPDAPAAVATIGVPAQNSALTGGLRVQSTLLDERLGLGFGVRSSSSRSYAVRAGIPPQIRAVDVPDVVAAEAMGEYRPFRAEPFWTSLRLQSNLPNGVVESPLPGAAAMGTVILLGLEYRRE